MLKVLQGYRRLFAFFFGDGWNLLRVVADTWDRPQERVTSSGQPIIEYRVPREVVDRYNVHYEELKARLRSLGTDRGLCGGAFILPMAVVRGCCAGIAAVFGWIPMLVFSLLQFVVAPYSLFAAVAAWFHVLPLFAVHFVFFAAIQAGTGLILSQFPLLQTHAYLPIDGKFIVWWFVIDQALCALFCVWTPYGRPVRYPPKRLLQSVGYGFINSKSYWLVLLLACQGFRIDLLAWTIMALLPVRIVAWTSGMLRPLLPSPSLHWTFQASMFYHSHRMVHLPCVYAQSHRHHHYLQDATPFDADFYGTGLPEEWAKLLTEVGLCMLCGIMPWSLSFSAVSLSIINKVGHTRTDSAEANFHVNHHAAHVRNFGLRRLPLDLLLGTEYKDVAIIGKNLQVSKHVERDHYVMVVKYTPSGAMV